LSAIKTKPARVETASPTKILLYDVESSPNLAWIWGKYEQDALGEFIKERQIISFAWQWLHEDKVNVLALPDFPGYKKDPEDNKALIAELHKVLSKADVVVGHNIDSFDDPMSNTDFIVHGLNPIPPHRTVDTLKFCRTKFRFNSNKLDDLGQRLGLGRKVKHWGFDLWARCMRGDMKAWALMKRYNVGDVKLLKKVYLKVRPWMKNHPNVCAPDKFPGCPICRSGRLVSQGSRIRAWGRAHSFQCKDCGKWSTGTIVDGNWRFSP
jgi:hypothetical protein